MSSTAAASTSRPSATPAPLDASRAEFEALCRELPRSSPRAWRFAAERAASRAGALLSEGLRIGYEHGFDSGAFMAHAYADEARGRTALGRTLDRRLLDRPTLVAFREIRTLAEQAVLDAVAAAGTGTPVVADLAAGPAPYVLAALEAHPGARAILRDVDGDALAQAQRAAAARGLGDRVTTARADAFDRGALAALEPRPDVVLELGLYGIEHDDAVVARHFADLAELVAPGQIVFNVQTRNREIEHIARVWVNARGERCVWRLRPLELVLGWAAAAGYEPASVTADSRGIYRVVRLVRSGA
jgi:putative methyltransferase